MHMKGIVYIKFSEMVEEKFGPNVLDDIIEMSDLPSQGIYTASGYYDHTEIVKLTMSLSKVSKMPPGDLLFAFGDYLFSDLYRMRPELAAFAKTSFDLISSIDSVIHPEVLKLYPDAQLPKFETIGRDDDSLSIVYRSSRHFDKLAEGLMNGCFTHFEEHISIVMLPYEEGTLFKLNKIR